MAPKNYGIDCGCHQDISLTHQIDDDELTISIETDSTLSTSSSKDSLFSVKDCEIETLTGLRHRVFRSIDIEELSHNLWLGDDDDKAFRRRRSRYLILILFYTMLTSSIACVAWVVVKPALQEALQQKKMRRFLHNDAAKLKKTIQRESPDKDYTILLKGSRLDLIQQSLDAHSKCSSLREIQVELDGADSLPEALFSHHAVKAAHSDNFSTNGIFLLSEDLVFSCEEIERAFESWRSDPIRLVGFFGFHQTNTNEGYSTDGNQFGIEFVHFGSGPFSMVSDRAVFVHQQYLSALASLKQDSCCQVSLSLQVSIMSSKSPVLVQAHPREMLDTHASRSSRWDSCTNESECSQKYVADWLNSLPSVTGEGLIVLE